MAVKETRKKDRQARPRKRSPSRLRPRATAKKTVVKAAVQACAKACPPKPAGQISRQARREACGQDGCCQRLSPSPLRSLRSKSVAKKPAATTGRRQACGQAGRKTRAQGRTGCQGGCLPKPRAARATPVAAKAPAPAPAKACGDEVSPQSNAADQGRLPSLRSSRSAEAPASRRRACRRPNRPTPAKSKAPKPAVKRLQRQRVNPDPGRRQTRDRRLHRTG